MRHSWPLLLQEEPLQSGQELVFPFVAGSFRFFQVTSGVAYWLVGSTLHELELGSLVALAPNITGAVLASQINQVVLRHFCFSPRSVVGLFSIAERAEISRQAWSEALILPATHPAAQAISRAPLPASAKTRLASRACLLQAAFLVLAEGASKVRETNSGGVSARRFLRHTSEALDISLLTHSTQEIADLCGCTRQHLNVLWHRELGCNIRSAQRELRLRLARQLVEQGPERISDIAHSVGFSNVSRFNAAFKSLFGCTPTECRKSVAKT